MYLLAQQIGRLEQDFLKEGGLRECMTCTLATLHDTLLQKLLS